MIRYLPTAISFSTLTSVDSRTRSHPSSNPLLPPGNIKKSHRCDSRISNLFARGEKKRKGPGSARNFYWRPFNAALPASFHPRSLSREDYSPLMASGSQWYQRNRDESRVIPWDRAINAVSSPSLIIPPAFSRQLPRGCFHALSFLSASTFFHQALAADGTRANDPCCCVLSQPLWLIALFRPHFPSSLVLSPEICIGSIEKRL